MRSSPWLHQRRSESAPPAQRPRDPPPISVKDQEVAVQRISRPTESAMHRQSLYWKLDGFMDRGFHSWSKMDLHSDCKRCMWTPEGAVKPGCKIRPLNVSATSLPPLNTNRSGQVNRSSDTGVSRESLSTARSEMSGSHSRGEHVLSMAGPATWRGGQQSSSRKPAPWKMANGGRFRFQKPPPSSSRSSRPWVLLQGLAVPRVSS